MKKKRLIKALGKTATVIGLIAIGYALRTVGAEKTIAQQQQELDLLWQYHVNTEDLLDSICAQKTNWFVDVMCEQDIYDKYNQTASEIKKMYE